VGELNWSQEGARIHGNRVTKSMSERDVQFLKIEIRRRGKEDGGKKEDLVV